MTDPYAWHSVADMVERDSIERIKALYPPFFMPPAAGYMLPDPQGGMYIWPTEQPKLTFRYVKRPWYRRLNDWLRGRS